METLKQTIKKYSSIKILPVYSFSLLFTFLFLIVPFEFANAGFKELMISAADVIFGNMFKFIGWIMMKIASLIATLGGQFLDMVIRFTIDGSNIQLGGVFQGWTIFRDLVNMAFIFILLYVSFMTVLQGASFGTRKILANVIIVGLFINFSYFLTGFVIDIGNSLGSMLYASITPNGVGVGGLLIDRMSLASLKEVGINVSNFDTGILYMFNALFFTIAGFVFFMGGMLFLSRHVSLIFVLMLSPIAFGAYILPNTQKHFSKWFSTLIGSTFVAPAYLLMLAVTITIASSGDLFGNAQSANVQAGTSGELSFPFLDNPGLLLNYIVIIGLLIASLKVAKDVSGSVATTATAWAGKAVGFTAATAGFAGRHTVGRVSRRLSESEGLKDLATSDNRFKRRLGTLGLTSAKATSNASFDARAGKVGSVLGSVGGGALGAAGMKVNSGRSGGQGGYSKIREDKIKKEVDFANDLAETRVSHEDRLEANKHEDDNVTRQEVQGGWKKELQQQQKENKKNETAYAIKERELKEKQEKFAKEKSHYTEADIVVTEAEHKKEQEELDGIKKSLEQEAREVERKVREIEEIGGEIQASKDRIVEITQAPGNNRRKARIEHLNRPKRNFFSITSSEDYHAGQEAAVKLRKKETDWDKLLKEARKAGEEGSKKSSGSTPPPPTPPPEPEV